MYFKRFIIVLLSFFLISYILFDFINKGLVLYDSNSYKKFDEMFNDTGFYNCVIIGNSRVHRNIDVKILDSITHKKNYNGGIAGAGGYEILTSLKAFTENHPATNEVILNVDEGLLKNDKRYFNPTLYLNSFNNNQIYNSFYKNGYPVYLYKWIPFTKMLEFNDDMRKNALTGLIGNKKTIQQCYHGYLPMQEIIGKFDTLYISNEKLNISKDDFCFFDSIINFCEANNMKLSFITNPGYNKHFYKKYFNYQEFILFVSNNYCKKYNINFLILDSIPSIYNTNNFSDNIHFNVLGTKLYTKELALKLNEVEKK